VPAVFGIPPLLPKPPLDLTGVCPAGRCAALPDVTQRRILNLNNLGQITMKY